jgi:hypothetical protein
MKIEGENFPQYIGNVKFDLLENEVQEITLPLSNLDLITLENVQSIARQNITLITDPVVNRVYDIAGKFFP